MPSLLGSKPNQVSTNGELGTMAFREQEQFLALAGAQTVTGAKTFSEIITASKGVAFPATQVASADVNTLDDYEEGTWTPTVGGTATYVQNAGTYTKIGRTVSITGTLRVSTIGTGSTTTISGLPFTCISAVGFSNSGYCGLFYSLSKSVYTVMPYITNNTTTVIFNTTTSATTDVNIADNIIGDSTQIYFSATYVID